MPSARPAPGPAAPSAGAAFDVCEGALALRALSVVNGAVLVGALLVAGHTDRALEVLGGALAVSLPATMAWLAVICLGRRPLAALSAPARHVALGALGALLALLAAGPLAWLDLFDATPLRLLALGLAGAGLALPLALWLHLRERLRSPADAGARLAELQSRIRPHFLFNTLNTAIALVRSDPARAESVLEGLADLFRVALEAPGSGAATTLGAELALARRYLQIEQLRFGDRLQVQWQLDPDADTAALPPLVLQPLLENAVRHGIEPLEAGGVVRVRTRVRAGQAEVGIDNPLPSDAGPTARSGHGVALANVRERLQLMHDLDARFEAGPAGERWRVRLTVPLAARSHGVTA